MCHLCPGDKRKACALWQTEECLQPVAGNLFNDCHGRPACMNGCVLIPGRGEPIRCHGGWQSAANDPAKESATGAAEDATRRVANQLVDDLRCICTMISERTAEACSKF